MNKWIRIGLLLTALAGLQEVKAQAQEAQQLLLNVEKLAQLKNILADLKKGYEVVFEGYTKIKRLAEGNFQLHDLFLQSLNEVSPTVRNYQRVGQIVQAQLQLVAEYKNAARQFKGSGLLHPGELEYISGVYAGLFRRSLKSLDDLSMVVTSGTLRMTDGERLAVIDGVWKELQDSRTFLRRFNNETKVLLLQRAKGQAEYRRLEELFPITD